MKSRVTKHAKKRMKQYQGNRVDSESLANGARNCGLFFADIPSDTCPMLKDYVARRYYNGKLIKLYKGYVFIFFSTSKRLITMYPIADYVLNEYETIRSLEDERHEQHRRERR